MDTYQLKLYIYFFNIIIYGDISIEGALQETQYWDQDLAKFGFPGTIKIGTTLSSLSVAANFPESLDSEMLTKVEVVVDKNAERRGDAFFEYVMPLSAKGLGIDQVAESELLPIVNDEEVFVPVPWGGLSTIQLIAPEGFVQDTEGNYFVESLRIVVSPEIPQS